MNRIVIGYGNELRRDDAAGLTVVSSLESRIKPDSCRLVATTQLTPELAFDLADMDEAIFIDATPIGIPGKTVWTPIHVEDYSNPVTGHEGSPGHLLDLTRSAFGRAPRAFLITICGVDFGYGEDLTPVVQKSVDALVEELTILVETNRPVDTRPEESIHA